jgi:hypothetical protein
MGMTNLAESIDVSAAFGSTSSSELKVELTRVEELNRKF